MFKIIIWIITVIGLLPVTLFALGHLIAMISFARMPKEQSEPGTVSFIFDMAIQLGPSNKLHLSTHSWPSVVVVAGALAVLVGLFFLLPRQPDRIHSGGFSRVESYVERLLRSPKKFASVIIATADGQHALVLTREAGQTILGVSADRTRND